MQILTPSFRGGAAEFLRSTWPEILFEGPAGTGKSFAILWAIWWWCSYYPGLRVLMFRKTRVSLNESVLVTWETKVLPANDPMLNGPTRRNRTSYRFPNGSELVLGGMDKASRILSTEYDVAYCNEATEIEEEEWEIVLSRLRNGRLKPQAGLHAQKKLDAWPKDEDGELLPRTLAIADCNPDAASHWLNLRADRICAEYTDVRAGSPMMHRVCGRHEDNPTIDEGYLARLRALTGVRRARLYEGLWVAAEGMVWPMWDPREHMVNRADVPVLEWHYASVDWGFKHPGVVQVWGVDGDGNSYRVAEIYRSLEDPVWWTDRIEELYHEFDIRRIVCDSAEPDRIEMLNKRLGPPGGRKTPGIALEANKSIQTGLEVVRECLSVPAYGTPKVRFVRDVNRYVDQHRRDEHKPWRTEDEIPVYVFEKIEPGKPDQKERPDPHCADHGCDALRYGCMWQYGKDLSDPKPAEPAYAPGTMGDVLGHAAVMARSRVRGV